MTSSEDLPAALRSAEVESLKLAAKGRLAVSAAIAALSLALFSGGLLTNTLVYIGLFSLLALGLLLVTGSRYDRWWIKYVLVLLEVVLLTDAVLTPNPFNPDPWPIAMAFRQDNFFYFMLLIALSVFSYQPQFVLWTGFCVAAVWSIGVAIMLAQPDVATFASRAPFESSTASLAAFNDPAVVVMSARAKEVVVALLLSAVLAAVVWRGRRGVERMVSLGEERQALQRLFGRYVPAEVSERLLRDDGWLAPEQRVATVLFVDVEGFTAKVENMPPAQTLDMLNEYFTAVSEVIARHAGVVTQFQGDAVLATFNAPLAVQDHRGRALRCALELQEACALRRFAGHTLKVRIGLNTGPVVAGSVGGPRRLFYTVHGDAVNVAARLEVMNKELRTRTLASADCIEGVVPGEASIRKVGDFELRGREDQTAVYEVRPPGAPDREIA